VASDDGGFCEPKVFPEFLTSREPKPELPTFPRVPKLPIVPKALWVPGVLPFAAGVGAVKPPKPPPERACGVPNAEVEGAGASPNKGAGGAPKVVVEVAGGAPKGEVEVAGRVPKAGRPNGEPECGAGLLDMLVARAGVGVPKLPPVAGGSVAATAAGATPPRGLGVLVGNEPNGEVELVDVGGIGRWAAGGLAVAGVGAATVPWAGVAAVLLLGSSLADREIPDDEA